MRRLLTLMRWPGVLTLALANTQASDVVFNNFDPGGGFDPSSAIEAAGAGLPPPDPPWSYIRAAAQFPVAGGSFRLASVTLPIAARKSSSGDFLTVRLTSDANGAPGQTLEWLSVSQGVWPGFSLPFTTATTLSSAAAPLLLEGEHYWIVTELAGPSEGRWPEEYDWFRNTNGSTVVFRSQSAFFAVPTDPWTALASINPENVAFRVEGIPAPPRIWISSKPVSQVELCWQSRSNLPYQIQSCLTLTSDTWTNWGAPISGDGSQKCQALPMVVSESWKFYRIAIVP